MDFSNLKSLSIPEGEVAEIICNDATLWKSGYTNLVPLSTEADGKTIYNGGLGYKNGYRVRSGGAEGATNSGACTGFIPVKSGDVVRFSGWDITAFRNENAINVANSSFANIGQTAGQGNYGIFLNGYSAYSLGSLVEEKTGVWKWVCPPEPNIAFMRISGFGDYPTENNLGSKMIVTVNEEIE